MCTFYFYFLFYTYFLINIYVMFILTYNSSYFTKAQMTRKFPHVCFLLQHFNASLQ